MSYDNTEKRGWMQDEGIVANVAKGLRDLADRLERGQVLSNTAMFYVGIGIPSHIPAAASERSLTPEEVQGIELDVREAFVKVEMGDLDLLVNPPVAVTQ